MVRLSDLAQAERDHLINLPCPTFDTQPWAEGPPISERRVAVISTAGLQRRDDRPFSRGDADYRVFHRDTPPDEIVMSHISVNFDRSGFQQDLNVVFPVERLKEMAADGEIGSVADFGYSFMGATDPEQMEPLVREIAGFLKEDQVNAVLLAPV
ncbi:MAG: selenoprotein B glycine/betaine/sarcosine/D-proline reductase [Rhodospirillaceae bacterium]|nr:selenoprotein B glycine/betaine/sarcosine/D-proline reductase [Rhodospirillaceae bacterium]|tara:strand:+ start:4441 stop:4902 length:462 start_codon:yes stop_codon:yes gene_type:complete